MFSKITTDEQYHQYCEQHKALGNQLADGIANEDKENQYYLLDLVIQDYHRSLRDPLLRLTPVELLKALLQEHSLSALAMSKELEIPPSVISEVLNYKRGFSKSLITRLAKRFDLPESVFLKSYPLKKRNDKLAS